MTSFSWLMILLLTYGQFILEIESTSSLLLMDDDDIDSENLDTDDSFDEGDNESFQPDDYIDNDVHWNYSKHLNDKNFIPYIQEQIDLGQTVFVRWTAGVHCGSCSLQAQSWDIIIRVFATNTRVSFGDVMVKDLDSTSTLLGPPHNPGNALHGGWPTIRYFNTETGLQGRDYIPTQSATLRKWQELSVFSIEHNHHHMYLINFIEEKSNTVLCDTITYENCNEKAVQFIKDVQKLNQIEMQSLLRKAIPNKYNSNTINNDGTIVYQQQQHISSVAWLFQQKYLILQLISQQLFH